MGLLSAGGVVAWIVDEMRGKLTQEPQPFLNAAHEGAVSSLARRRGNAPKSPSSRLRNYS
jgi:hypothetical protein